MQLNPGLNTVDRLKPSGSANTPANNMHGEIFGHACLSYLTGEEPHSQLSSTPKD